MFNHKTFILMNPQKTVQLEEKIALLEYNHDKLDKVVIF